MLGLVLAVCLVEADADDGIAVEGAVSPERSTTAPAPKPHLAQLGALDEANDSVAIAHSVTSDDVAYHGIRVATLTAIEKANDCRADTATGVFVRTTGEPGELRISWNAVAGADAYIVEWRQRHEEFGTGRRQVVRGTATTTTLTDLDGDTLYIIRVTATEEGWRLGLFNVATTTVATTTPSASRSSLRGWRLGLFTVATTTPSSSRP